MPPSFTVVTQGSDRVVHVHNQDRTSSRGSASAQSAASSGGSRSLSSDESWSEVEVEYEDDIEPSDRAVQARPHPARHSSRRVVEREELPTRRHSSHRHHSSRHDSHSRHGRSSSRRVPSDESSGTVASADDYPPYGHPGMPRANYPPMPGYRQPQQQHPPQGYPPSMTSSSTYPDPYANPHGALVHMRSDPFGYPQHPTNPFSPGSSQQNPFSPMSTNDTSSYFATDPMGPPPPRHPRPDAPQRPQSFAAPSHYGSELMAPYHPGVQGYAPYGMPGYPQYAPAPGGWPHGPSSTGSSPPPRESRESKSNMEIEALKAQFTELVKKREEEAASKKKDEKTAEIESLKELIKKHQVEAMAQQAAWVAEREAEAAARAAEKAKAEEEKKRKIELDDAKKKAKEDAEKKAEEAAKKAKEEHDKKLAEAEKLKEEADKAKKALEEQIAKSKPTPDELKAPIKFKDAVGRKFSFPWRICKTWKGMETLIKQAFLHVDVIGDHVHQGHYDLTGPDGEIILPQVWDTMVQPDWEITMHLWPMEDEKKRGPMHDPLIGLNDPFGTHGLGGLPGLGDFGMMPPKPRKGGGGKKGDAAKPKKKASPETHMVHPMMPPPPPSHGPPPGGAFPDPFIGLGGSFGLPPGVSAVSERKDKDRGKARAKSKGGKEISPLAAWFAGGSLGAKPAKKR